MHLTLASIFARGSFQKHRGKGRGSSPSTYREEKVLQTVDSYYRLYFTRESAPLLPVPLPHLLVPGTHWPAFTMPPAFLPSHAGCRIPALPEKEQRRLFGSLTNSFLAGGARFLSDENVTLCSHSKLFPEHCFEWAAIPPICSFWNVLCQSHVHPHTFILTGSVEGHLKCFLIFFAAGISPWLLIGSEWNVHSG